MNKFSPGDKSRPDPFGQIRHCICQVQFLLSMDKCVMRMSLAKMTLINSSDTHAFKPRIGVELFSTT